MMQPLKLVKQMSQHVCTFALYSHDMTRQIETHHYVTRLNQDFLQCAVYDSDDFDDRLIDVEYIVSNKIFKLLLPDEQKLWHSHAYEIKASIWNKHMWSYGLGSHMRRARHRRHPPIPGRQRALAEDSSDQGPTTRFSNEVNQESLIESSGANVA
ncbi:hypothetical protein PS2_044187 [Malus domestica]